jgi:hypothetical protein
MSDLRQGLGGAAMSGASGHPPVDTNNGNELEEARVDLQLTFSDCDDIETSNEEEFDESTDVPMCQKILEKNRNSLKLLLSMAVGCAVHDDSIANMDLEPYKSAREKKDLYPTGEQLKDEIIRRAKLFQLKRIPRPKGWNGARAREWLTSNPIRNDVDLRYLQKTERELRAKLHLAFNEREDHIQEKQNEESWYGQKPFLRLYHVLMEDDIREAYIHRHDTPARDAFDARNCDDHPATFYELAAERFNSPEFNPTTNVYPNLHSDFAASIELPFGDAPTPVTAMKIKEKFGETRSHLVRVRGFVSVPEAIFLILLITHSSLQPLTPLYITS